jgi:ferrous iron transport protein A
MWAKAVRLDAEVFHGMTARAGVSSGAVDPAVVSLARGRKGLRGVVAQVDGHAGGLDGAAALELERRLLEIGFVEGASIEILHEGFIGRDPIAVRVDDMRVALRRQEAASVLIEPSAEIGRRAS